MTAVTTNFNNSTGAITLADKNKQTGAGALDNVGFDTFLKMLTTQLQNQDPLNPMEGTQFTEQLATFSSLEQQIKTNDQISQLLEGRDFSQQALAVSYIGKEVLAPNSQLNLVNGEVDFGYELEGTAQTNHIEIVNAEGETVRVIQGETREGIYQLTWDGKDADGNALEDGSYKAFITAYSPEGKKVPATLHGYSTVVGSAADQDNITLTLANGTGVDFDNVLAVRAAHQGDE